jgi:C-terminal processing protease CtpA/Prc
MRKLGASLLLASILLLAGNFTGTGLSTAKAQSRKSYAKDLTEFYTHVDKKYPFFDLKGIRKDWAKVKKQLWKRVRTVRSDADFILLIYDGIKCLRDAHMGLRNPRGGYPKFPPTYYPGVGFMPATKKRVIIMCPPPGKEAVLKPGVVVTKIDGKPARKVLDEMAKKSWKEGGFFSSPQRARLFVYRTPFRGKKGEKHVIHYLDEKKKEKKLTLRSDTEVRGWPHTYNFPKDVQRVGRSFFFQQMPSGVGYMYWRRIDSSITQGITKALEAYPDAKGWIVDLRGNGGGGYSRTLIQMLKDLPQPLAGILDAGCISAGETMARDLVQYGKARLFGQKTAGSSTSKAEWKFPSGIASLLFSTRSRYGIGGKLIEFNGVEPHVMVEPDPEEVLQGKNSAIERAQEYLLKAKGGK